MFQGFGDGLRRFMAGRNGVDGLAWFWCIVGIALNLAGSITGLTLLTALAYVPLALAVWRIFSRDTARRYRKMKNSGSSLAESRAGRTIAISNAPGAKRRFEFPGERESSALPAPPAGRAL